MTEQAHSAPRPTAAGLYDAYLGGRNHTLAEQEAAEKMREVLPEMGESYRALGACTSTTTPAPCRSAVT